MEKIIRLFIVFFCCSCLASYGQEKQIIGKVTSADGTKGLPGVNVRIKGTNKGTSTAADGSFTLKNVSEFNNLVFSYLGYVTVSEKIGNRNEIIIAMQEAESQIEEVVVTALGVSREKKSLGYSTATVSNAILNETKNISPLDALNGRVAGLSVSTASGAPGASTIVNIRGLSSVTGNNQPLYVIDGVPMNNRSNTSSSKALSSLEKEDVSRSMDFGNQMNDINPNDIENISVLKGVSATVLYGSRAANGAIIITTKRGKNGKVKVDLSSSVAQSEVLRVPHLQNKYGQGWSGLFAHEENGSWGPEMDGQTRLWGNQVNNAELLKPFSAQKDNIRDFFNRGYELNNSVALSGGTELANFRLSYSNAKADGVVPTNADSYERNTVGLNTGLKIKKFTVNANLNYVSKNQKAVATGQDDDSGGGNVVWQELIQVPVDHSIVDYNHLNDNSIYSDFMSLDYFHTPYAQNPYWTLYNQGNQYLEDRFYGNLELGYELIKGLNLKWRLGSDVSYAFQKDWGNKGIINSGTANSTANNIAGSVAEMALNNQQFNSDVIIDFNTKFDPKVDFQALVGYNLNQRTTHRQISKVTTLDLSEFYQLSNSSITPVTRSKDEIRRLVGVFASTTVGYDNWLYATLTGRNDWSSTLPKANNSFFYPSASISAVLSQVLNLPKAISFAKIRLGVASSANDTDPYQIFPVYDPAEALAGGFGSIKFPFGGVNSYEISGNPGNPNLKPEISTEYEAGLEMNFYQKRIGLDFSYYDKVTDNQIVELNPDPATGYTRQMLNLGRVRNKGIELAVNLVPIKIKNWEWGVDFNFNKINNKIEVLGLNNSTSLLLNDSYDVKFKAEVGKPLGALYSPDVKRNAAGQVIVNPTTGLPLTADQDVYRGTNNHDYTLGIASYVSYKGFRLSANADYRKGGVFYSYTARLNYFVGNAWESQYNDRQPYVYPNSVVEKVNPETKQVTYAENLNPISRANIFTYYGGADVTSNQHRHVLDKTFFKLRNVSLNYSIPSKYTKKLKMSDASVGVYGRNLILWTPSENHFVDPEANTFGGDIENLYGEFSAGPSTFNYGVQLNFSF
ncbi:MAG: SusC/RagA family TonB-linked outer membrane protein [Pseudarcicella sp.]|nr:SusC/RagA family TonB-linked outer membrane protein [Pseudarcicella sp.]